jgi:predicted nucleic acid-binding protein
LFAERRQRVTPTQRGEALNQLARLPILTDPDTATHAWLSTFSLAQRFSLTLYDACYLELAQRRGLPLATLDRDLRAAGSTLGIKLLGFDA